MELDAAGRYFEAFRAAGCVCTMAALLWCGLGCCSRTVVELRRTYAFIMAKIVCGGICCYNLRLSPPTMQLGHGQAMGRAAAVTNGRWPGHSRVPVSRGCSTSLSIRRSRLYCSSEYNSLLLLLPRSRELARGVDTESHVDSRCRHQSHGSGSFPGSRECARQCSRRAIGHRRLSSRRLWPWLHCTKEPRRRSAALALDPIRNRFNRSASRQTTN